MFRIGASTLTVPPVLMGACALIASIPAYAEDISARLSRASYFAASMKYAAFPARKSNDTMALLVVDLETERLKKLSVKGSNILSPYLSADGRRLLFVHHPVNKQISELVSCNIENLSCDRLLRNEDRSIGFPVEVGQDRILYVSSPLVIGSNGSKRYGRYDLWLLPSQGEPRKLTDMKLSSLSSISISKDAVYFSADGSPPDRLIVPRMDYNATKQSEIFSLPFDPLKGDVLNPTQPLQPLFLQTGKVRSPFISSDNSVVAYLRSSTTGNYRYDLVVRSEPDSSERTISVPGLWFSNPVVVNHSAFANAIYANQYAIHVVHPGKELKRFAPITDAAIDQAELVELTINHEPGKR